jgi:hypothetical protein
MKKIRLDLERLDVESFEISAEPADRGTVQGHYSQVGTCDGRFVATCQAGGTCRYTCNKCTVYCTI